MWNQLWNAIASGEGAALTGTVVVVGIALSLLLRALVARSQRARLHMPAVLLLAAGCIWALLEFWSPSAATRRLVRVVPMLLVLLAFGRLGSVMLFDWALSRRLQRDPPKIVRDIAEGVIAILSLLFALRAAGVEAVPLVTTSAMITAILVLSLQDTLGNLLAGLALQAQRPFEIGEWIQLDKEGVQIGRVLEMNWRATKLLTPDNQELNVPNGQLARTPILNLSRPGRLFRRVIEVLLPYEFAPRQSCAVIERALIGLPHVLPTPVPTVAPVAFVEQGIRYRIIVHVGQFEHRDATDIAVRERLWYALRRAGIPIARGAGVPFGPVPGDPDRALDLRAKAIRRIAFLRDLPDSAVQTLAADAYTELYVPGEIVVRQGDPGEELYLCLSGELVVVLTLDTGDKQEIARITEGGLFGEFAQVTGEARAATVQVVQECELVVIGRKSFTSVLSTNPEFAEVISQRLAERRAELDAFELKATESRRPSLEEQKGQFLRRLREFLSL